MNEQNLETKFFYQETLQVVKRFQKSVPRYVILLPFMRPLE